MKICPLLDGWRIMNEKTLRIWAQELGFGQAALCSADDFVMTKCLIDEQPDLPERRQLRFSPVNDYPEIRSLAVLLWPYMAAPNCSGKEVFVDNYYEASNLAYHAARQLEKKLIEAGCFACANVPYPAREAAVRARLGVIGRNSMLITPEYGTRVVIILMATDVPVEQNEKCALGDCLACGRCKAICPSGAIDENGMSHPERCLRNYMMEGIIVPEHIREKMRMTMIGCDLCQRVCPMQTAASDSLRQDFMTLDEFITEDALSFKAAVERLGKHIGVNLARPQRVRAQAALLAGNSKESAYLPVLETWSKLPFEAVREHSLWAISQICGDLEKREQDLINR